MKVKLEWLRELVDLEGIELKELLNKLSLYSIEVEGVTKLVEATNLVVGYVLECRKHENSDHLSVCLVDVGSEKLQIVCGAPNVKAGQYVIVALPEATLPGGLKIKKTKLRGVESNGMICSLSELGIEKKYIEEEYQNGIFYFKEKVEVGTDALKALNLDDYTIALGLTPNRGDLLSMIGVAIEVSAILNRPLKPLIKSEIFEELPGKLEVKNETDKCLGYFGRLIRNVEIKPSPRWLISRLIAFGIRPINNCVDITNYVLALFGQPLHAFDYEKLGDKIVIRLAKEGEEITTLDNEKRTLLSTDIVITDGSKPVALAGIMGGLDSEVTENTIDIVLEAAVFSPESVRATSQRLGLRSDSSIRFEKGVDLNRTKLALDYATYLLMKYANGKPSVTKYEGIEKLEPKKIKITKVEVEKVLGISITEEEIKEILERLQFEVKPNLEVIVPTRRNDINIKEDLIEEIGRVYGYEKLPLTLPKTITVGALNKKQQLRRKIVDTLVGLGLNENITYSLVDLESNNIFKVLHKETSENVSLLMPLSQDRRVLRKSLIPSLLECIKYSYNRKLENIGIFELGRVYYKDETFQEEEHLAIAVSNEYTKSLNHKIHVDFYLLKGIVEELFNKLNINLEFLPLTEKYSELHPGRSAQIVLNGNLIGYMGAIHPKFAKDNDLDDVYVFETKLEPIYEYVQPEFKFNPIPKVPSVERDIAIVVDKNILAKDIVDSIKDVKNTNIKEINIFDVYTGEKIGLDKKSIAINLVFETFETLTDEAINEKVNKVLKTLESKFKAELRM